MNQIRKKLERWTGLWVLLAFLGACSLLLVGGQGLPEWFDEGMSLYVLVLMVPVAALFWYGSRLTLQVDNLTAERDQARAVVSQLSLEIVAEAIYFIECHPRARRWNSAGQEVRQWLTDKLMMAYCDPHSRVTNDDRRKLMDRFKEVALRLGGDTINNSARIRLLGLQLDLEKRIKGIFP